MHEPETSGHLAEALREAAARGAGGAEPRDPSIGVEAGLPFAELSRILAESRQTLPLDPPFAARADAYTPSHPATPGGSRLRRMEPWRLTRRGRTPVQPRFPHFDVPPDAPIIRAAEVQRILDQQGIC